MRNWYFLHVIMLLGCVFLTSMLETNVKPVKKLTDGIFFWLGLFFSNACQYFPREVFDVRQALMSGNVCTDPSEHRILVPPQGREGGHRPERRRVKE